MEMDDARRRGFLSRFLAVESSLRGYCIAHVHDFSIAEDLLQQIALVLWTKFEHYDPTRPFLPWALGFASIRKGPYELTRHVSAISGFQRGVLGDPLAYRRGERAAGMPAHEGQENEPAGQRHGSEFRSRPGKTKSVRIGVGSREDAPGLLSQGDPFHQDLRLLRQNSSHTLAIPSEGSWSGVKPSETWPIAPGQ